MTVYENHSLLLHNTFQLECKARYFVNLNSLEEFGILQDLEVYQMKKLILGGGSNVLLTNDFDGLVIKNHLMGKKQTSEDDTYVYVKAGAGENWHRFVLWCIENNWGGVENLSLIPGSVGASPMQNIGAYGTEIKDVFHSLEAIHLETGVIHVFDKESCEFAYRESVFKKKLKDKYLIISVTFKLRKIPVLNTAYGAIEKELERMGIINPTLKDVSNAVIAIRTSKLPNPEILGNAGSFFKNPEITLSHFEMLKEKFPEIVAYPAGESRMKIAAGWLIEKAGWKGKKHGKAGVHENQALVIVNLGNASGKDILELSDRIQVSIKEIFDITLEKEVNIIK